VSRTWLRTNENLLPLKMFFCGRRNISPKSQHEASSVREARERRKQWCFIFHILWRNIFHSTESHASKQSSFPPQPHGSRWIKRKDPMKNNA
jgi:hypothetical protein